MLIRITNSCRMGCSHCMIDSTPSGTHMNPDVYGEALEFTSKYDPSLIFLSGGEPTDHPQFLDYLQQAKWYMSKGKVLYVLVASNGMFLENESYTQEILKIGVPFQITNDPRFYPKRINKKEHMLLNYEDTIRLVTPMGRALTNKIPSTRQSPMCFNLRSVCRNFDNLKGALTHLRSAGKMCSPSINVSGRIVAGESKSCFMIGNVRNTEEIILNNISNIQCGRCGLQENLTGIHKTLWEDMEGI